MKHPMTAPELGCGADRRDMRALLLSPERAVAAYIVSLAFRKTGVRVALVLGGVVLGCASSPREAVDSRQPPTIVMVPAATVTTGGADAGAPPVQLVDLLHPQRVSGLPAGEWTISYPTEDVVFERILRNPRGGFVALGVENAPLGGRFLLALDDEGTPRWAVRLTLKLAWPDADLAVGDDGTIALVAAHGERVIVEGQEVVAGSGPDAAVSLLLFGENGKLRRVRSRKQRSAARSTQVVWHGGFVTTRMDLFDPQEPPPDGFVTFDTQGEVLRKSTRPLAPLLLASGRDLVAISLKSDIVQGGRTLLRTSAKGSPYMAVALDRTGAFLWGHAFAEPLHEQTAVAQDERGHVFAAFRHGESHGFADDPFAAIVYELDDKGREVRRFTYDPNATFTRLLPAPGGLTVIGWSRHPEPTFKGTVVPLPGDDIDHGLRSVLLMRLAPDGHALAFRHLLNKHFTFHTPTKMVTIADAVSAGDAHLAVVGAVTEQTPFAGVSVDKGKPPSWFVARIRRP